MYENRNWCPQTEPLTGLDALLKALESGWHIEGNCCMQFVNVQGGRFFGYYHFLLRQGDIVRIMNVLQNPRLAYLLEQRDIETIVVYAQTPDETQVEATAENFPVTVASPEQQPEPAMAQ